MLALSTASFIYIAVADLIPSLHRQVTIAASLRQLVLLLAGIGTFVLFRFRGGALGLTVRATSTMPDPSSAATWATFHAATFSAIRTTLECRQVSLLRSLLKIAQYAVNVIAACLPQQPRVHFAVGDLSTYARPAGLLQAGVTLYLSVPGIGGSGQPVALEKAQQRLDVARLGFADIDEWPNITEIGDHLVVGFPSAVFVVQRFVQDLDFQVGKNVHIRPRQADSL